MRALAGAARVLVLAREGQQAWVELELRDLMLETGISQAELGPGRGQLIPWVEQCLCPAGYIGLSCSKCAPGSDNFFTMPRKTS